MSQAHSNASVSEKRSNPRPAMGVSGLVAWLLSHVRTLRNRRATAKLRDLDDRTLADIGISRAEVEFFVTHGRILECQRPHV